MFHQPYVQVVIQQYIHAIHKRDSGGCCDNINNSGNLAKTGQWLHHAMPVYEDLAPTW